MLWSVFVWRGFALLKTKIHQRAKISITKCFSLIGNLVEIKKNICILISHSILEWSLQVWSISAIIKCCSPEHFHFFELILIIFDTYNFHIICHWYALSSLANVSWSAYLVMLKSHNVPNSQPKIKFVKYKINGITLKSWT